MQNPFSTVISQYGSAPTLTQLVANYNTYLDPTANLAQFYTIVLNVLTATGFGLDIWGRIVNVSRTLQVPVTGTFLFFGFEEGGGQPFGQAPFNTGVPYTQPDTLTDEPYRTLILAKALVNISNSTSRFYNQLLQSVFAGRGRAYVLDTGSMTMEYVFEFGLTPDETAIMSQSGVFDAPAGVQTIITQGDFTNNFGFQEAGSFQPFNQGFFLAN